MNSSHIIPLVMNNGDHSGQSFDPEDDPGAHVAFCQVPDSDPTPLEQIISREDEEELDRRLAPVYAALGRGLSQREYAVLRLRIELNLPVSEIAVVERMTEKAVERAYERAIKKLRRAVGVS